jgi:hypothetical protein
MGFMAGEGTIAATWSTILNWVHPKSTQNMNQMERQRKALNRTGVVFDLFASTPLQSERRKGFSASVLGLVAERRKEGD